MADGAPTFPARYDELGHYTQVLVDEAVRRGISVEVGDPSLGELVMAHDGVRHTMLESLTDLTSAVAFRRCDDKALTRQVMERAGLCVPAGRLATGDAGDRAFLDEWKDLVVKPVRGEQGWGITVGVTTVDELRAAVDAARDVHPEVLLEQRCPGEDVRVIVIGGEVVAAAVRRPATVVGDGRSTIAELVDRLGGASGAAGVGPVTMDETTLAVLTAADHGPDDVLAPGQRLAIRRTANVHTGGTITDITEALHPALAEVCRRAAAALDIPVVGLDLMVPDLRGAAYVVIEANEQPGLANHEPAPTIERFIDLLFPTTARRPTPEL